MTNNLLIIYISIGLGLQILMQIKNLILGRMFGMKTLVDVDTKLFMVIIALETIIWPIEVILSTIGIIKVILNIKPTEFEKICDEAYDKFIDEN